MVATDTRSQILQAALDLFAMHGYEKTTMRAIAKKVGIQSASIYYFFDSKEGLLKEIFSEFISNFAKYRTPPDAIWSAAKEKPLSEALSMMFYTFGSPEERDRMMGISRVILSLQFENVVAQKILEKVLMQDALDYGMNVLRGLHILGLIREIDFKWTAFTFHAFAVAVFQESLRTLKPHETSSKEYEDGIRFVCSSFAKIIGKQDACT